MQENERQRVSCGKYCNFCFQTLTFSPPKKDEFNFKLAQYCINKARSASSIWNHKYDFRPKLHDTRFNYHFITSILKSLKYRTWLVQIFYWCSTCMHWYSKLNLCPPSMDLHHESPQLLKPTSTGKDLDSKVLKITSWTALFTFILQGNNNALSCVSRKKFGWMTFAVNLLTYLLFIVPLTTLAVYTRTHEDDLCGFNSSNPNEVSFAGYKTIQWIWQFTWKKPMYFYSNKDPSQYQTW